MHEESGIVRQKAKGLRGESDMLMWFQMEMKTLLGIGLEATLVKCHSKQTNKQKRTYIYPHLKTLMRDQA